MREFAGWIVAGAVITGGLYWSFDADAKPFCLDKSFNEWVKSKAK